MSQSLTRPASHNCPTCQTYNRAQDKHAAQMPDLMAECPVCADKRKRGEPIEPEPMYE